MQPFHDFDPYDVLVTMNERLSNLEKAHNNLAHAHEKSLHDFNLLQKRYHNLEKSHLALAETYFQTELTKLSPQK